MKEQLKVQFIYEYSLVDYEAKPHRLDWTNYMDAKKCQVNLHILMGSEPA